MNDLVYLKNNEAFTDSMVIAVGTENQHATITKILRRYRSDFEEFGELRFSDFVSKNPKGGRPSRIYLLNEMQATLLVTYLGNNDIVRVFKVRLVKQFHAMRDIIAAQRAERKIAEWIEMRQYGKAIRRAETDAIKDFVEYAVSQGSHNANMYYIHFSNMANKLAGVSDRDTASFIQLNNIGIYEQIISNVIYAGMEQEVSYKQIFMDCKARCEQAQEIAFLTAS